MHPDFRLPMIWENIKTLRSSSVTTRLLLRAGEEQLKDIELRLVSELLKNSRRSDRELAKHIGVSQPTVSRIISKLRKEGVIKEFTIIPDFKKLGYHICALTFAEFQTPTDLQAMRRLIEEYGQRLAEIPQAIMIERGIGETSNGVVLSLHQSYADYKEFEKWIKQFSAMSKYELHNFLIDLDDKIHFRPLTFSTIAKHLTEKENKNR